MVSKRQVTQEGHRRKFLAVVDSTPECEKAIHYAARRVAAIDADLVLVYVIEPGDFQHWLGVEDVMRAEARAAAEAALAKALAREKKGSHAWWVLSTILNNVALARAKDAPLCQDTGTLIFVFRVPVGSDTNALVARTRSAISKATRRGYPACAQVANRLLGNE